MMRSAIEEFFRQFEYEPQIVNGEGLQKYSKFVVVGMGGSHLAADLLLTWKPSLNLKVWSDYGLPHIPQDELDKTLVIASSYSGNTEEAIDAFHKAREIGVTVLAISIGGKLLELAKKYQTSYIQMPDTGIQPRSALGFSFRAMLKAIGEEEALKKTKELTHTLRPLDYESAGKALAQKIKGFVPIIYSSSRNSSIAYNWKIKFNETGKIPAFYNVLPELNHNEMTGFDVQEATRNLSKNFYFLLLKDQEVRLPQEVGLPYNGDHPKILKRMQVLEKLFEDRELEVEVVEMKDGSRLEKIFSSLVLADWTAYYTAEQYGVEAEQVPMVEEFKKLIQE